MKIFIINLPKSVERKQHMIREMERLNLAYEFIEAIDGRELTEEELDERIDRPCYMQNPLWSTRGRGIVGAALSHQIIYKKMIAEGIPRALVLEDDIFINSDIVPILEKLDAMDGALGEKELVLFRTVSFFGKETELSSQHTVPLTKNYALMYPINLENLWSAIAYSVSLESAKKFMETFPLSGYSADAWGVFYEKNIFYPIRCVAPFPVNTGGIFDSDISNNTQGGDLKVKVKSFLYRHAPGLYTDLFKIKRQIGILRYPGYVIKPECSPCDPDCASDRTEGA